MTPLCGIGLQSEQGLVKFKFEVDLNSVNRLPLCIFIISIWECFCMVGQHQNDDFNVVLQTMQKYHDAHFEHQCQNFSKPNFLNFLHSLQDHIKVTILMLAKLAKVFSDAYNKNPKWQSLNRNKINLKFEFHQTNSTLQTKTTQGCQIILASHP